MHIVNNVIMQLVLGILLEMVHKWWRVLVIYFVGVLAGSLATSSESLSLLAKSYDQKCQNIVYVTKYFAIIVAEPYNFLAGASGGVYALIAAHLSTVILVSIFYQIFKLAYHDAPIFFTKFTHIAYI